MSAKILLVQLDGKCPNLALMRIAAHHRSRGDEVTLAHGGERGLWDSDWEKVYASAIFLKSKPAVDRLLREYPGAIVGGTGVSLERRLEDLGITTNEQDYSIYPDFRQSIGFTQRGCRLRCSFCVVPRTEGPIQEVSTIHQIWRGDPWPRELLLLDNDFFGQPNWRERIAEIRDGNFKVSFNQGINARFLTDEAAEAIASVDYRDDSMKVKRIYTAWDGRPKYRNSETLVDAAEMFRRHGFELDESVKSPVMDERLLFDGLNRLVKYGVKPDQIMVYMLIGYWPDETHAHREYRRKRIRDFGARPYPMPYVRTPELVGFQRFCVGSYDKRVSWEDWAGNNWRPEGIGQAATFPLLEVC